MEKNLIVGVDITQAEFWDMVYRGEFDNNIKVMGREGRKLSLLVVGLCLLSLLFIYLF